MKNATGIKIGIRESEENEWRPMLFEVLESSGDYQVRSTRRPNEHKELLGCTRTKKV